MISHVQHHSLAGTLTLKVWWSKIGRYKSQDISQSHLIIFNLVTHESLIKSRQVLMGPGVMSNLVTITMCAKNDLTVTTSWIINCLCKVMTSNKEGSLHVVTGKQVQDLVGKIGCRAIIVSN